MNATTSVEIDRVVAFPGRIGRVWPWMALILGLIVAYANSFHGVFVLDDEQSILGNPSIVALTDLGAVFSPPELSTTLGRPVANFSFAVDHELWGFDPRGYHASNLLIHIGAALLLFGIVRRVWWRWERQNGADTRSDPAIGRANQSSLEATGWAVAIAAIWALHPLQTESVTYIVQRVESLAGLFYLLTVYAFMRGVAEPQRGRWILLSVVSCWLGVLTKETVVSAPLVVLVLDRTVYARTVRESLRQRGWYYLGLCAAWLPLGAILLRSGDRNATAGLDTLVTSWQYLLTSCRAIVMYLRLSLWPDALTFDYGRAVVWHLETVWPQAVLLVGLALATAYGIWRRSMAGVVGLWFFAILAPSSSVVPVATQTMAEHRMYLPLLALVVTLAAVAWRWLGPRGWLALLLLVPVLGWLTYERNAVYGSAITLWRDTVDKQPTNARALNNLANALLAAGRAAEALPYYEAGTEMMKGKDAVLLANHALALLELGRLDEAEGKARRSLVVEPRCSLAMTALAQVAVRRSQPDLALAWLDKAIEVAPEDGGAWLERGNLFWRQGKAEEAERSYRRVLVLDRDNGRAEFGLGRLAYDGGRWDDAVAHYRRAVKSAPGVAEGHNNLAGALIKIGETEEGRAEYARAIAIDPKLAIARFNHATMLAQAGRLEDAVAQYRIALEQVPGNTEGLLNCGLALQLLGRLTEARERYREALRIEPENAMAQTRLASLPADGPMSD